MVVFVAAAQDKHNCSVEIFRESKCEKHFAILKQTSESGIKISWLSAFMCRFVLDYQQKIAIFVFGRVLEKTSAECDELAIGGWFEVD